MEDNRINYYVPADFTEDSKLDRLVRTIIDTTVSNEKLMAIHYRNKQEQAKHNGKVDNQECKEKEKLIIDLENSNSFKQTHSIISKLKKIENWTPDEKLQLKLIVEKNKQVSYIKDDEDENQCKVSLPDKYVIFEIKYFDSYDEFEEFRAILG